MRYRVHAVDIYGISHAAYESNCATDEEAQHIAASYLPRYPVIEVRQGSRRVAQLNSDDDR